jgi:ribosomal protein L12E/L44/L45/RPP1/RPP2
MTRYCPSCGAEYLDTVTQCADCAVPLETSPPVTQAPLTDQAADHEILVYELDQWEPERRTQVEVLLAQAGITYEWEGTDLLVPAAREADVDELLDKVDFPDALPLEAAEGAGDEMDDEAIYQVMSDLFVIADRIADAGKVDLAVAGDFILAAAAAESTPPPFGFEEHTWQQVQRLATTISDQLENEEEDATVVAGARTLRDALRGFV